jgi:hypothetical protein
MPWPRGQFEPPCIALSNTRLPQANRLCVRGDAWARVASQGSVSGKSLASLQVPSAPADLVDAPWDAYIAAPGDDPTLRETTFGGGRGQLSFRVDDDAEMIHVFAITWIG